MTETAINLESANLQLNKVFAPWVQSLNLSVARVEADEVDLFMPYSDELCRSHEMVCGQSMMALIDTCMVFVCYLGQGRYGNCTTVSQNTSFMRPVIGQGIIATGRIVKAGRQLVFGEVTLRAEETGKTVGQGTSTYMLLPE